MVHPAAVTIVEDLIPSLVYKLTDADDRVTALMAETNCDGFDCEESNDLKARFWGQGKIKFFASLLLIGDQYADMIVCGSQILVELQGTALTSDNRNDWQITEYEILRAKITDF